MTKRFHSGNRADVHSAIAALLACFTLLVTCLAAPAFAQCQYEVTAIITPDDENACFLLPPSPTFGQGMNIHADVVGYYWPCALGNDEAFFWSEETGFVTLPKPPGVTRAWAYDINDNRMIVGQHEISGVGRKGFVYDMNKNDGQFMYLEPLHDGVVALNVSSANAVNSNGLVAGSRSISKPGEPNVYNAVIWDTNTGEVIDLGVIEGPNSWASDIREEGHVAVGWDGTTTPTSTTGRIWVDGFPIDLGAIPGGDTSWVSFINDESIVSGSGMNLAGLYNRAFLWREGKFTVIDPPIQFNSSTGGAVNDVRQLLVRCATGSTSRPYLWQHGEMTDLNELTTSGPLLTHTSDINNNGQILVRASTRAVLLTPIDVQMADLNYDCNVDLYDLLILLDQWGSVSRSAATGKATGVPSADLNGDGLVDVLDLLILLEHWTR